MSVTRRHFLRQAAAVSAGFGGLRLLLGPRALAGAEESGASSRERLPTRRAGARISPDFGPLVRDPEGLFDLPADFSYRIISRFGDRMDDGFLVPHWADGMAAFPGPDGTTVLVCNHEVRPENAMAHGPFGRDFELARRLAPDDVYDFGRDFHPAGGGTTTIVYDTREQRVVRRFLSLAGTIRNCAGGPTPWNTWLSCEETSVLPDELYARSHGWVFEVPAVAEPALARPVPIEGMGRFQHEAVAVDPASGVVYQTEDEHDGLLYRYVPDVPGELLAGGRLQALVVRGRPRMDTRNWLRREAWVGRPLRVEWIDLEDVHSPRGDLRYRGFDGGAARFARGEGMWYGNGVVYFACTNGGPARLGQIWKYTPSPAEATPGERREPGVLQLFIESYDDRVLENADNLTVAPWGDLFVCEDGRADQFLVGVTPEGSLYHFGRNAHSTSELAGATFSPDGTTLFMNIQMDGLTLAITGPWERGG